MNMPNINISIRLGLYETLEKLKQTNRHKNFSDVIDNLIETAGAQKQEVDRDLKEKIKGIVEEVLIEKQNY